MLRERRGRAHLQLQLAQPEGPDRGPGERHEHALHADDPGRPDQDADNAASVSERDQDSVQSEPRENHQGAPADDLRQQPEHQGHEAAVQGQQGNRGLPLQAVSEGRRADEAPVQALDADRVHSRRQPQGDADDHHRERRLHAHRRRQAAQGQQRFRGQGDRFSL